MSDGRRARSPPPTPNPMVRYTDMSPVSPFFPSTYSPPSPPLSFPPPKQSVWATLRGRRSLLCTIAAASVVIIIALNSAAYYTSGYTLYPSSFHESNETVTTVRTSQKPPIDRLAALRGAPTMKFRDNLREDTKYIHSWLSAGWTNDVMTYANLIYLGWITDRVPIVHVFNNAHTPDTPSIPFRQIFDLDRLSTELQLPVVEWDEVKNSTSTEIEELGCWNVWEAVQYREHHPRDAWGQTQQKQGLDLSWTRAPETIKIIPGYEHDQWARIWDIATLTFDSGREKSLEEPKITESPINHHSSLPDEHLACFDYLYYTSATISEEFWHTYSPVWREVARHMRWNPALQTMADDHLRRMFNLTAIDAIPPFIAIHARHGDFFDYCEYAGVSHEACFPSMAEYQAEVQRIRNALQAKLGVSPTHVVVLSDEKDPAWWAEIRAQGWSTPVYDDEKAIEEYGKTWYAVLHDAVILSSGLGMLGTPDSTYSLLAGRRVIDWHGGVYREIKWEARGKGGRELPLP